MSTINESLAKFKEKTDALVNSKYLFAEREISEVLKVIAGSRMLYELFEYVTDGFDYETFKSVCFSKGNAVKLPKKDEDLLALCFLLLVEIDGGRVSLDELCDEYFSSGNSAQGKYSQFVLAVVIPFSITTEKVVNKLINSQKDDKNDGESDNENDFDAEFFGSGDGKNNKSNKNNGKNSEKNAGSPAAENEGGNARDNRTGKGKFGFIEEERRKLAAVKKPQLREPAEEADYVLNALERALKKRDYEGVTIAFIALKYLAATEKKLKIDLRKASDGIAAEMDKKQ